MFRLAPTPSGFLHIGNAFSFLLTKKLAEKYDQKIFLRIDDLDAERKRPEYVQDIFDSLEWLGIEWHEGPKDAADFAKNWSQELRREEYNKAILKLARNKHLFACECSRKQLEQFDRRYPGTCQHKNIPLDEPGHALRVIVPAGRKVEFKDEHSGTQIVDLDAVSGSFIICRRDGIPAYHLASVVDDIRFGVSYVVRGMDLLHSTTSQVFLAETLGANEFWKTKFLHHMLLPDEHGQKLSKSEGSLSLRAMRNNGMKKEDVMEKLEGYLRMYE